MRRCATLALAAMIATLTALPVGAGEGTTGADFLNIPAGARSAALAGCYASLGDAESMFYNPAGILNLLNPQVGLSHIAWWEGVAYDALWGVQPLGEHGALGISAALLSIMPFNSTEDPALAPEQGGSLMAGVGYAFRPGKPWTLGGQLKVLTSTLSSARAWGLGLDAGVQYHLLNDQMILAATLQNFGFLTAFETSQDPMPMKAGLSAAYHFWPDEMNRFSLIAEATQPISGTKPSLAAGGELWFWNTLALRGGAKTGADAGDWLALGAGVHWQSFHLDYALSPLGLLGPVHRISAGYDFGSQRRLARPKLKVILLTKQFVGAAGKACYEIQFVPTAQVEAGLRNWELQITDRSGREVRRLAGKEILPVRVVWDGRDRSGNLMDIEGYYAYNLGIWDRMGYHAVASGEILPVSVTKLPQLKAAPRDIFAGRMGFSPAATADVREWSIEVLGEDGRLVKKYTGIGMIPKNFAWDGTNQANQPVALKEGFQFVIRTKDEQGNERKTSAPLLVVDAGTKAYSESSLVVAEEVPFHFKFSAGLKSKGWSLDILKQADGKVVRAYTGEGQIPESVVWDSRDEQHRLLPNDQTYSYLLRLQDPMGNIWSQAGPIRPTPVKVLTDSQDSGLKIKIERILFEFNKAELKPEMFDKLHKCADIFKAYPRDKVRLQVEGHTDEVGTDTYNLELSIKRANMVMRFLVEEEGIPSAMIEPRGYGKNQPLSLKNDPEIRSQNRRVEITLTLPRGAY